MKISREGWEALALGTTSLKYLRLQAKQSALMLVMRRYLLTPNIDDIEQKSFDLKGGEARTRQTETLKCSQSRTFRPRKLKHCHNVDLLSLE